LPSKQFQLHNSKARATYHPITYHTVDEILKWDKYLDEVQSDSLEHAKN
jgi:hypothetical protein